jgi:hypothetical protein
MREDPKWNLKRSRDVLIIKNLKKKSEIIRNVKISLFFFYFTSPSNLFLFFLVFCSFWLQLLEEGYRWGNKEKTIGQWKIQWVKLIFLYIFKLL